VTCIAGLWGQIVRSIGGTMVWQHEPQEAPRMTTISFDLPDEAMLSMHVPPPELAHELRMAAAVKLYELGRLSSGAAARLAGVPRVLFLAKLADYGVDTFRMTEEELLADVRNA
jgi:predicted HTH domain antitoxin